VPVQEVSRIRKYLVNIMQEKLWIWVVLEYFITKNDIYLEEKLWRKKGDDTNEKESCVVKKMDNVWNIYS